MQASGVKTSPSFLSRDIMRTLTSNESVSSPAGSCPRVRTSSFPCEPRPISFRYSDRGHPNRRILMSNERVARHRAKLESEELYSIGKEAAYRAEKREEFEKTSGSESFVASTSGNGAIDCDLHDMRKEVSQEHLQCCTSDLVQVKIDHTYWKRCVAKFLFPAAYPNDRLVTQLSSQTIEQELLRRLEVACSNEASKHIGHSQVLAVYRMLDKRMSSKFVPAFKEIQELKSILCPPHSIELVEKSGRIKLHLVNGKYWIDVQFEIGGNYPVEPPAIQCRASNFPSSVCDAVIQHARDVARKLAFPPTLPNNGVIDASNEEDISKVQGRKSKSRLPMQTALSRYHEASVRQQAREKAMATQETRMERLKNHVPKHSIVVVSLYLKEEVVEVLPSETCCICRKPVLPVDPANAPSLDPHHPLALDQLYCGHFYHHKCLEMYISTPPFGKCCLKCSHPIHHHNFVTNKNTLEQRWAHKQAKQREIDDIKDMFG